jgi:hypothetical protein
VSVSIAAGVAVQPHRGRNRRRRPALQVNLEDAALRCHPATAIEWSLQTGLQPPSGATRWPSSSPGRSGDPAGGVLSWWANIIPSFEHPRARQGAPARSYTSRHRRRRVPGASLRGGGTEGGDAGMDDRVPVGSSAPRPRLPSALSADDTTAGPTDALRGLGPHIAVPVPPARQAAAVDCFTTPPPGAPWDLPKGYRFLWTFPGMDGRPVGQTCVYKCRCTKPMRSPRRWSCASLRREPGPARPTWRTDASSG